MATTVSVEQQQFSNSAEISHDLADCFHEIFTEKKNREILIRKKSAYFQNKDSEFSDTSRTYKDGNKSVARYFN